MSVLFFDSTLRDGSHAVKHKLSKDVIANYCKRIDTSGMHTVIVGHGNGLGASSLQVGLSLLTDEEMLSAARENLVSAKLGAFMIPGFGTIKDNLIPAMSSGVELFCIGCHCTEADTTRQHIEFLKTNNKETYGILMMYHMASLEKIIEEAYKMESYGADGVILMDSAGASTPELVKRTISSLANLLKVKVGFHPHNNLGLAVANAYTAIKEGATIIDGTACGFGAGAGNLQLEALIALLQKEEFKPIPDLYKIMDAGNEIQSLISRPTGIDNLNIVSGMAGVFSSFATQAKATAEQYKIDARDIFIELGKRKVVGGQEDVIIEIAEKIKEKKSSDEITFQLESLL